MGTCVEFYPHPVGWFGQLRLRQEELNLGVDLSGTEHIKGKFLWALGVGLLVGSVSAELLDAPERFCAWKGSGG